MLGSSPFNMSGSGCYIASISMACWALGKPITPGDLCDMASEKGLFDSQGNFSGWRITDIIPEIVQVASETTDLNGIKGNKPVKDAIAEIQGLLESRAVILQVDLSPHNGVKQGDHFVYCTGWNYGNPTIFDPWFGKSTTLSENYGKPEEAIFGYRAFGLKEPMKPLNLDDNTLVQLAEGSGGFGLYANKKLYIDDTAKILASWLVRCGGDTKGKTVAVKLKDWNAFNHFSLKNDKLT